MLTKDRVCTRSWGQKYAVFTEEHLLKRRFMPRGWSDASLPVLGRDARAMAVLAH